MRYRVEWAKYQERERKKEEEEREKERVAYAQIDWHDFVVVETVDFQPNEQGSMTIGTPGPDVARTIVINLFIWCFSKATSPHLPLQRSLVLESSSRSAMRSMEKVRRWRWKLRVRMKRMNGRNEPEVNPHSLTKTHKCRTWMR